MNTKDTSIELAKFLADPLVSGIRDRLYVPFDRAVMWICYGVFADANSRAETLQDALENWLKRAKGDLDDEFHPNSGHELATAQLTNAVRRNLVHLIAKYSIPSEGDLVPKSYRPPDRLFQIITSVELDDRDIVEIGNGWFHVGEHTAELLLVPFAQLDEVFGALVQSLVTGLQVQAKAIGPAPQLGRPPKWDWEWMYVELVRLANKPDGLPGTQAELERWVEKLFQTKFGHSPDESHIRKKISPIFHTLMLPKT